MEIKLIKICLEKNDVGHPSETPENNGLMSDIFLNFFLM